jgi:hypothetical protein
MYSFFMGPKFSPEFTNGQAIKYTKLAQMTKFSDSGRERLANLAPKSPEWAVAWAAKSEEGTVIAPVPLEAKFQRDRFNEGVVGEWYLPGFDDSKWGTEDTFYTWDAQDKPEDAKGHDYDGYGWYRFTVNVPAKAVNKPLKLHLGGVINEGWVWINGNYAGHRPWKLWWEGRDGKEMDVDATGKVKAGDNVVAVRVWNNAEIGGLFRRGFLWAPNEYWDCDNNRALPVSLD